MKPLFRKNSFRGISFQPIFKILQNEKINTLPCKKAIITTYSSGIRNIDTNKCLYYIKIVATRKEHAKFSVFGFMDSFIFADLLNNGFVKYVQIRHDSE